MTVAPSRSSSESLVRPTKSFRTPKNRTFTRMIVSVSGYVEKYGEDEVEAFVDRCMSIDDLIDFTPALRAEATQLVSKFKVGPIFTPPVVSKAEGPIAAFRSSGGMNWPGFSYDPETHIAYVPSFISFSPRDSPERFSHFI